MKMSDLPLVTVYIPTFNRVSLLERAVNSVRNQTYKNIELIIVDDCSTDGTQEYLAKLVKEDQRVRYFLKEKNSGACVSRNIAIENATGEFITGLDDDDYFLENRIEIFLNAIDNLDKYIFLASKYMHKTINGLSSSKIDRFKPEEVEAEDLLSHNYINNQIFVRTSVLKENLFNPKIPAWQDLYTWYKILRNAGKAKILNHVTYIVDTSHPHERITTKNIKKIEEAFVIFSNDFDLTDKQKKILSCHFVNYDSNRKKRYNLWLSFLNSINLYSFLYFLKRFLGLDGYK